MVVVQYASIILAPLVLFFGHGLLSSLLISSANTPATILLNIKLHPFVYMNSGMLAQKVKHNGQLNGLKSILNFFSISSHIGVSCNTAPIQATANINS